MAKISKETKELDKVFGDFIRKRDNYTCFFCGKEGKQPSHFWSRGNASVRYHPDNVDTVCGGCHMRHEGNKQGRYRYKKVEQLGAQRYVDLEHLANTKVPLKEAREQCREFLGI